MLNLEMSPIAYFWRAGLLTICLMAVGSAVYADYDDIVVDAGRTFDSSAEIGSLPGGISVTGRAGGKDDRDFFRFNVQQSGDFAIKLKPDSRILWLYLFDQNGNLLERTRNAPAAINPIVRTFETGAYHIKVQRSGDYGSEYSLTIVESSGVPIEIDESAEVATAVGEPSKENDLKEAPSLVETTARRRRGGQRRRRAAERREAQRVKRLIRKLRRQAGEGNPVPAQFKIFDRINFEGKPNLIQENGMNKLQFIGEGHLWKYGEDRTDPNFEKIREVAAGLNPDYPVCLNIEHWHTNAKEEELEESINKLIAVVNAIKEVNPDLKIGYYRMLPVRNYFTPIKHTPGDWSWNNWERQNRQLERLAEHVDIIFPSLYTIKPDFHANGSPNPGEYANYAKYVRENIKQARRYGKPVYAWVSPYYLPVPHYWSEQEINGVYFQFILEEVTRHADGVVIWTSHSGRGRGWNPNRSWWVATRQYTARREISKLASFD